MGNEAAPLLIMEHTPHLYAYETIETTRDIAAKVQSMMANRVDQVALVTLALCFDIEGKTSSGHPLHTNASASTLHFLNNLRPLVRKTDVVFLLSSTCYFLLLGANLQGGQIVQTRLWDALLWRIHNTPDGEILRPSGIASGYSAHPVPSQTINDFIEAASAISIRSNFAPEKSIRKSAAKQSRGSQENAADEELPALARKLGIPYLSLLPRKPPQRVQQLVNPKLAQELHCYPLGRERNRLTVAMVNPQDRLALERLRQATGLDIFPVLTHPQELQTVLEQLV